MIDEKLQSFFLFYTRDTTWFLMYLGYLGFLIHYCSLTLRRSSLLINAIICFSSV